MEFKRHAPDHVAARRRVSLGAYLPALRTERIQLLEHVRCVVGGPGHGLVLKGFHLPHPPDKCSVAIARPARGSVMWGLQGVRLQLPGATGSLYG